MKLNLEKMSEVFYRNSEKLENIPILVSIRKGLTYMIPFLLLGSIALVFISIPIPVYQNKMVEFFGPDWKNLFLFIRDSTFNILSLIMVLCISYSMVIEYNQKNASAINPLIVSLVSMSSFIATIGISKQSFSIGSIGTEGVFIAVVVSVFSSLLFVKLTTVEFLKIRVFTDGADSTFQNAMASIFPAIITITVFALFDHLLASLFHIDDVQTFLSDVLNKAFSNVNSTFWTGILFVFLIHIFWFLGMHGSNILEPVAQNMFVTALNTNQTAISIGQTPPNIYTKTFFDTFVLMGGCGTTLCLILAIFISARHKNRRSHAKLSLIPVVFNINEMIVFGIPIVLNPVYVVPFLFIPLLLTAISFLAMYFGIVPYTRNLVEWTTPVFLSGYISTGSIRGSMLQLFNLSIGTICYIPFVRLSEKIANTQTANNLKKLYSAYKADEERGVSSSLLTRHDEIGNIARFLTSELEHDLKNDKVKLYYQPQTNYEGKVFGVEALLRWKHDSYGFIYPPLVIALAEEMQYTDILGDWIIDTACMDLEKLNIAGDMDIVMSINISALQLDSDNFVEHLKESIKKYHVKPDRLKIEITEQVALTGGKKIMDRIEEMRGIGIKFAMDDFGMGHSSLMYLKEYEFDTIKLDGSLVRDLLSKNSCRNIISSIVTLGESLNYTVIAEYVEQEEQRLILHDIGCDRYQGYLYSEALPYHKLIDYIKKRIDITI
ncbi:MAG: EAL domain-containing protein [Herbinix sp.]|nr:EAL domain-containing protein [Herbinix sp.]